MDKLMLHIPCLRIVLLNYMGSCFWQQAPPSLTICLDKCLNMLFKFVPVVQLTISPKSFLLDASFIELVNDLQFWTVVQLTIRPKPVLGLWGIPLMEHHILEMWKPCLPTQTLPSRCLSALSPDMMSNHAWWHPATSLVLTKTLQYNLCPG